MEESAKFLKKKKKKNKHFRETKTSFRGYHTPVMTLFLFLHVKFQMFRRQQMVIQVDRNANNFIMWFLKITAMSKKNNNKQANMQSRQIKQTKIVPGLH